MADVTDIEEAMDKHRKWIADGDKNEGTLGLAHMRMYDGISLMLVEVIRELRDLKEAVRNRDA